MNQKSWTSITDLPKNASDNDNIGIDPFEKGLIKFIKGTNTPITIALQGEWGSGKTSLMNTLKKNLAEENDSKFHAVWLNTWEFALMNDPQQTLIDIVSNLIQEISIISHINDDKRKQLLNKIWDVGKSTMVVAAKAAAQKTVGMGDVIEHLASSNGTSTISELSRELQDIINNCLEKDGKEGFIFFIDDLDRIDPPAAVELLELLKNIFTLNRCVFVLAIDYDVVIKGLKPKFGEFSEKNEREFRSFFDKIIQVPFSMPVGNYKIDNFLRDSLLSTGYINQEQAKNKKLIDAFTEISGLSVGTNPRGLKRLLNSLSLIKCINEETKDSNESDQLDEDLEIITNFSLVSIQIAFPKVYKLLTEYSGFDHWNENTALQMNLKTLDKQSIEKLESSPEFDEPWEQVLFRLCETDHYLKKKALSISRLLNKLKTLIEEKDENIEDIIGSVISLSSVTNVEAFDKRELNYHRGNLLKGIRNRLVPKLHELLPDIKNHIYQRGKRVQSNLLLNIFEDGRNWIRMNSHPFEGKIKLVFSVGIWMGRKDINFENQMKAKGLWDSFAAINKEYENVISGVNGIESDKLINSISIWKNDYFVNFCPTCLLPDVESFYKEENIEKIAEVMVNIIRLLGQLRKLENVFIDQENSN